MVKPSYGHVNQHGLCGMRTRLDAGHAQNLSGPDINTVQELLGHSDVKTTMIYTHVLNRGPAGFEARLTGFEKEAEDFMLTRIRRHDNKGQKTQVTESEEIIGIVFSTSVAYYPGQMPLVRRLRGSI